MELLYICNSTFQVKNFSANAVNNPVEGNQKTDPKIKKTYIPQD